MQIEELRSKRYAKSVHIVRMLLRGTLNQGFITHTPVITYLSMNDTTHLTTFLSMNLNVMVTELMKEHELTGKHCDKVNEILEWCFLG